jgi:YD repeat-containing protein
MSIPTQEDYFTYDKGIWRTELSWRRYLLLYDPAPRTGAVLAKGLQAYTYDAAGQLTEWSLFRAKHHIIQT